MPRCRLAVQCALAIGAEAATLLPAIERLAAMLGDASSAVVSCVLWCLANLCSDSFDGKSSETKRLLLESLRAVHSELGENEAAAAAVGKLKVMGVPTSPPPKKWRDC